MKYINTKTISSLKILGLSIIFLVGFSVVSSWIGPTSSAPYENIAAPVHTGTQTQYKYGNLVVKDDPELEDGTLEGSFISNKITVEGSEFGPSYFFNQFNIGSPYIETGAGTDPKLISESNASIYFTGLGAHAGVSYPTPTCVDEGGNVSLCVDLLPVPEVPEEYTAGGRITVVWNPDGAAVSCPAEYPHAIGGGVSCSDDGLFDSGKVEGSHPGGLGSDTLAGSWTSGCKGWDDETAESWAICMK